MVRCGARHDLRMITTVAAMCAALLLAAIGPGVFGSVSPVAAASPLQWTTAGPRVLVLPRGGPGSLDSYRAFQPSVVRALNGSYFMYYTGFDGSRNRILGAYSPDGIDWTKLGGSILLNDGAGSPFVMMVGSQYRMWFESVVWNQGPLGYTDRIYAATSTDGANWSIGGVALDVGSVGAWDAGTVGDPWVDQGTNGLYRMYYGMWAANGSVAIGVATSGDLVTFTKWSGNPVLLPGPSGAWDDYATESPSVVSGPEWALFYEGHRYGSPGQVGLATSPDGYHWTRSATPFLGPDAAGTWDSGGLGGPDLQPTSSARLYFSGGNATGEQIGMVNVAAPSIGGGTTTTVLGLPMLSFVLLVAVVGVGVAGLAAFVFASRRGSGRPPR